MEIKKLKLQKLDITPLSERELSKVLGGFVEATTAGGGSSSAGTSSSASYSNGADSDGTSDSDSDKDS